MFDMESCYYYVTLVCPVYVCELLVLAQYEVRVYLTLTNDLSAYICIELTVSFELAVSFQLYYSTLQTRYVRSHTRAT
jgi:hypothetical protein